MTDVRELDPPTPLRHVAIIMDGNNRWARKHQLGGISGHRHGVENVRKVLGACRRHNIETLTLFAFSSENWQRPPAEVRGLMSLFATYIRNESRKLKDEGVSLKIIGERGRFSQGLRRRIELAEKLTEGGDSSLVLAVDYGGRWDITRAARSLAEQVEQHIQAIKTPLKIAVMGCVVNGPGEAREADIGVAGGKGVGIIFKKGKLFKAVA